MKAIIYEGIKDVKVREVGYMWIRPAFNTWDDSKYT